MTMQFFRKHQRGMLWFIVFFIGIPFAFFGISTPSGGRAQTAGELFGEPVSYPELQNFNTRWSATMGRSFMSEAMVWREMTLTQTADSLGIQVLDDEVDDVIRRRFADEDGKYNPEYYRSFLADRKHLSNETFRKTIKELMSSQKLLAGFSLTGGYAKDELMDATFRTHHEIKLAYLAVDASMIQEIEDPSDEILGAFHETRRQDYRFDDRVQGEYILVGASKIREGITLSDEEIRAFLAENKEKYTHRARIKKQEKANPVDPSAKAKQDAVEDISVSDEEILKFLDESIRADLLDARVEEAVDKKMHTLFKHLREHDDKIGALIQIEDRKLKKLGEESNPAADVIKARIAQLNKERLNVPFQPLAEAVGATYGISDLFSEADATKLPKIGSIELRKAIRHLATGNYSGSLTGPDMSQFIFRTLKKEPPRDKQFEESKDEIRADWLKIEKLKRLRAKALTLQEAVPEAAHLAAVAEKAGLKVQVSDWFKMYDAFPIQDIGFRPDLTSRLFVTPLGILNAPVLDQEGSRLYLVEVLAHRRALDNIAPQPMAVVGKQAMLRGIDDDIARFSRRKIYQPPQRTR